MLVQHVGRDDNAVADFLCQAARDVAGTVVLSEYGWETRPGGPAPCKLAEEWPTRMQLMTTHLGPRRAASWYVTRCRVCEESTAVGEPNVVVCGGCSSSFHARCVHLPEVPRAPYYCSECLVDYERE